MKKCNSTFYRRNAFLKKRFCHFLFYDIYIYKKNRSFNKIYTNTLEKKKKYFNKNYIIQKNFKLINTKKFDYKIKSKYKDYNESLNKFYYKKDIFESLQNFFENKYFRNKIDYIYNYNNNFKGVLNSLFLKEYFQIYNTDANNLITQNIHKKINGYSLFFEKDYKINLDKLFFKQNIKYFEKEKLKLEENINKKIIYIENKIEKNKNFTKLDIDEIYEKIKEKIFDEVFMMLGNN